MKSQSIYIVLTKTTTILSQLIAGITGNTYTHASIALDKDLSVMYSFGRKQRYNPFWGGFCCEDLNAGLFSDCNILPFAVVEIKVTREQYDQVHSLIQIYKENSRLYGYNYIGLILAAFGRACKYRYRFYCSEFVHDLLAQIGVICKSPPVAVRPQDLMQYGEVIRQGNWSVLSPSEVDSSRLFGINYISQISEWGVLING